MSGHGLQDGVCQLESSSDSSRRRLPVPSFDVQRPASEYGRYAISRIWAPRDSRVYLTPQSDLHHHPKLLATPRP